MYSELYSLLRNVYSFLYLREFHNSPYMDYYETLKNSIFEDKEIELVLKNFHLKNFMLQ